MRHLQVSQQVQREHERSRADPTGSQMHLKSSAFSSATRHTVADWEQSASDTKVLQLYICPVYTNVCTAA